MQHARLGNTGLIVSRLAFGAMTFGSDTRFPSVTKVDIDLARTLVNRSLDAGINFFDTAPFYGATQSETLLGKALKGVSRERFYLATKVGRYGISPKDFDFSAKRVIRSVDESLKRLQVAHIDLIQCHDIEFVSLREVAEEAIPALERLKTQGKVRRIGVTALPLKVLQEIVGMVDVDTVLSYCHYCLNDTTLVQLAPQLKAKGIGLINGSPLAMGLLSEQGPPDWHPAPAKLRTVCAKAVAYCKSKKHDPAQLAIQFALSNKDVATTLLGVADPKRIKRVVGWIDGRINQPLLADVQDILKPIQNKTWPSGRA